MKPADITRALGNYGQAYDAPGTKRAFTYKHQPGNGAAWRLGVVALNLANQRNPCGDNIDAGLHLLAVLEQKGFGVFEIDDAAMRQEKENG